MEMLINSGRIAEIILVVMLLEAVIVGLVALKRDDAFGLPGYLAGLAAGAFLVLALRAALAGSGWMQIAVFLACSLLAHVAELFVRLFVPLKKSGTARPHVEP